MSTITGALFEGERPKAPATAGWKTVLAVVTAVLLTFAVTWYVLKPVGVKERPAAAIPPPAAPVRNDIQAPPPVSPAVPAPAAQPPAGAVPAAPAAVKAATPRAAQKAAAGTGGCPGPDCGRRCRRPAHDAGVAQEDRGSAGADSRSDDGGASRHQTVRDRLAGRATCPACGCERFPDAGGGRCLRCQDNGHLPGPGQVLPIGQVFRDSTGLRRWPG